MKKMFFKIIVIIISIILIAIASVFILKDKATCSIYKYLQIKNIPLDDIYSLQVPFDYKMGRFYMKIVYKKEPDLVYYYHYEEGYLYFDFIYKDNCSIVTINDEAENEEDKIVPLYEDNITKVFREVLKYNTFDYIKDKFRNLVK